MTIEEMKALKVGQIIYQSNATNADGTLRRWKVTSVKVWKRDPSRVEIGIKHGLRTFDKLTPAYAHLVQLTPNKS